jgi:ATP-binding cassette subfamily F protein uup
LAKGDRIGIVGGNGAGKTSLLRAVIGELEPISGSIKLGETMKVAYFEQSRANLDPEASIFENVIGNRGDVQVGKDLITPHAYLGRFQFPRKRVRDQVKLLSGGERARVALAKLLIEPVNLLLLDEPTNDLDVATLSALEEMLISTGATAIVVTHDRYFLDRIATSVLAFEGEGRVVHYASAHQALEGAKRFRASKTGGEIAYAGKATDRPSNQKSKKKKAGLTYGERIELETIMERVATCEEAAEAAEAEMSAPDLYSDRSDEVPKLAAALEQRQSELAEAIARWEFLEAKRDLES